MHSLFFFPNIKALTSNNLSPGCRNGAAGPSGRTFVMNIPCENKNKTYLISIFFHLTKI